MLVFSTHRDNLLFQEHINYMVYRFVLTIQQIYQQSYYPVSFENVACTASGILYPQFRYIRLCEIHVQENFYYNRVSLSINYHII